MTFSLVQDEAALRALCARLAGAAWIALDTEFMRTRTYSARLCLLQVATPEVIACVDPLALSIDPLLDVLYDPRTLKVLHAARQDLEVFFDLRRAGTRQCRERHDGTDAGGRATHGAVAEDAESDRQAVPTPVFDTQIAAALCGQDDQIGYGALVEKITGHKLPKVNQRADWAARPLLPDLLTYAADDVRYLCDVYRHFEQKLAELERRDWLEEECAALTDPALYRNDPDQAWRRLKQGKMLLPTQQPVLRELAAWRERVAQRKNLPRGWVVPDPLLADIARVQPENAEQLAAIAGTEPALVRRFGHDILETVRAAAQLPAQRLWAESPRLEPAQQRLMETVNAHLQACAREHSVSATLLAPRREMVKFVLAEPDCALLRGWRRNLIGEALLAVCDADLTKTKTE